MLGMMIQTPGDRLDYDVDFAPWLDAGDTLATAGAEVVPEGLNMESVSFDGTKVKVWLSGGVPGATYTVTLTTTTKQGRRKSEAFRLRIKE